MAKTIASLAWTLLACLYANAHELELHLADTRHESEGASAAASRPSLLLPDMCAEAFRVEVCFEQITWCSLCVGSRGAVRLNLTSIWSVDVADATVVALLLAGTTILGTETVLALSEVVQELVKDAALAMILLAPIWSD